MQSRSGLILQRLAASLQHQAQIEPTSLQNTRHAGMSRTSPLEPREDLHDFDQFAARALASDVHAGRPLGPLRAIFVRIDQA